MAMTEETMKKFIENEESAFSYCTSDESVFADKVYEEETCFKKAVSFCKRIKKDVNILFFEGNGYTLECNVFGTIKYNHGNVFYDELVPFWK